MKEVIKLKVIQNKEVRNNLINTGFRDIYFTDKNDYYWGQGLTGKGKNMLGKILVEIREEFYN